MLSRWTLQSFPECGLRHSGRLELTMRPGLSDLIAHLRAFPLPKESPSRSVNIRR